MARPTHGHPTNPDSPPSHDNSQRDALELAIESLDNAEDHHPPSTASGMNIKSEAEQKKMLYSVPELPKRAAPVMEPTKFIHYVPEQHLPPLDGLSRFRAAQTKGPPRTKSLPTSMPPPAAPASMLSSLRPSAQARGEGTQLKDPSYVVRLVGAAATLLRMGRASESRLIGQFTIDMAGQEAWSAELKERMEAAVQPDEALFVHKILDEAVEMIKLQDAAMGAYLEGMLKVMR